MIFIPGRMTNLLQPADVLWFAPIKKKFKKYWSDWFMHDNKSLTKQGNTKSPGYVKCCEWLSEIWSHYDSEILKKSFVICGIQNIGLNQQLQVSIVWNSLHSVLRKMLETKKVVNVQITDYIDPEEIDHFDENDLMFSETVQNNADRISDSEIDSDLEPNSDSESDSDTESDSFDYNRQSWNQHNPQVESSNIQQELVYFTPPSSVSSHSSSSGSSCNTDQSSTTDSSSIPILPSTSGSIQTPTTQVTTTKRVRRTKEQIQQGISLESIKRTKLNL